MNLTAAERQASPKMGDKTVAFVSKALEYANENTTLTPPYLDIAEFQKDMDLIQQLQAVYRPLSVIVEGLDDTIMLAGSEAYSAALVFYKSIRIAKELNVAGTTLIHDDLKVRFPGRGK